MKTKICPVCGKTFEPSIFNSNYCSDECKNKKQEKEKPFINPINLAPKHWDTEFTELDEVILNGGIKPSHYNEEDMSDLPF